MNYNSIADIYAENEKIRHRLTTLLDTITDEEAAALPEGQKWPITQIVEHLSMVSIGTARICSRLLEGAKASGKVSDGTFVLRENLGERVIEVAGLKVEAPERVQPTGNVTLGESIQHLAASSHTLDAIRDDLESYDLSGNTFPHPVFGDLTAAEWLVVAGLHERRHTDQIERLLERVRQ